MSTTQQVSSQDLELVECILGRIGADLGMIIDHSVDVKECQAERAESRVAGEGGIHISFRFSVSSEGSSREGCLLLPLAEAITVAGYLMMMSDDDIIEHRTHDTLDTSMKEAILEVGNFVAGACDSVYRGISSEASTVRAEGCQGVRADVRPMLDYAEGDALLVGRAKVAIREFPDFEMILMLPTPS